MVKVQASVELGEKDVILKTLTTLVEPLAALLPGECEVVLHDLSDLSRSIVAIAGNLTGRRIGDPAPDSLVQARDKGVFGTSLGNRVRHPNGLELRSSTLIFRDASGKAVAVLCVNNDTKDWASALKLVRSMLPWTGNEPRGSEQQGSDQQGSDQQGSDQQSSRAALPDVDNLARELLTRALASIDIPVDLMHKRHKIAVVRELNDGGYFLLRESVETAAQALGVTRFTIYNYLNELEEPTGEA